MLSRRSVLMSVLLASASAAFSNPTAAPSLKGVKRAPRSVPETLSSGHAMTIKENPAAPNSDRRSIEIRNGVRSSPNPAMRSTKPEQ